MTKIPHPVTSGFSCNFFFFWFLTLFPQSFQPKTNHTLFATGGPIAG